MIFSKLIISKDSMIYLVQLLLSFNQGQGKGNIFIETAIIY